MEKPSPQFQSAIVASLREKLRESLLSVMPVSLLVLGLSLTPWVSISVRELLVFLASALLLVLGIGLFNLGADMAMTPMGQYIGQGLTASKRMGVLMSVGFFMGLLITIAEPDLSVLAEQVKAVMNGTLLIATVGVGVGLLLLIGVVKIIFHMDLTNLLLFFYMVLFCLAALLIDAGRLPHGHVLRLGRRYHRPHHRALHHGPGSRYRPHGGWPQRCGKPSGARGD